MFDRDGEHAPFRMCEEEVTLAGAASCGRDTGVDKARVRDARAPLELCTRRITGLLELEKLTLFREKAACACDAMVEVEEDDEEEGIAVVEENCKLWDGVLSGGAALAERGGYSGGLSDLRSC